MTPIVRTRPAKAPIAPLPPPPAANKAPEPLPIQSDSPLFKLLQGSGRTPTHPLTARATAEPKKVTPVDMQKAEQAFRQAEVHAKRGRLGEAYKALEKAYLLNPENEKIVEGLSAVLLKGGKVDLAFNLVSEFLERHPEAVNFRILRTDLAEFMIGQIQIDANQASPDQQEKLVAMAQELFLIGATDKAMAYQLRAGELREKLQAFQNNASKLHSLDLASKAKALAGLQTQSEELYKLSQLTTLTGPEGETIAKELKAMAGESAAALISFVEADDDPQIRGQASLLKAKKALAESQGAEAIGVLENYRESECKVLGGGDTEKGLALLKEKVQAAKSLVAEKKLEEASKALEGIPEPLIQAHEVLEKYQAESRRAANIAAVAAWMDEIARDGEAARAKAGGVGEAWDHLMHNPTDREKADIQESKERNLASEVRGRLRTGKNQTIFEALKEISEGSDAELKEVALRVLAGSGFFPFTSRAGRLAAYGASLQPDKEKGAELLKEAAELASGDEEQKKAAAGIYKMVYLLSRDPDQRKEAEQGFNSH